MKNFLFYILLELWNCFNKEICINSLRNVGNLWWIFFFINDFQSYISLKVWKYFNKNKNTLPHFKISKIYEENFVSLLFFFSRFYKEFLILTLGWLYRNILTKIKIYFIFWNTKNFIDKFIHRKKFPILYCP